MKKVYESPIVEVVTINSEDVITVSGNTGFASNFNLDTDGANTIEF